MCLKPMSTSTTAWTWFAMDFSSGELVSESFAVRFKTEDPATIFKNKFEECQTALRKSTNVVQPKLVESKSISTLTVTHKEGSWECEGCFSRNDATMLKCPCCETIKPGEAAPAITPSLITATTPAAPAFKFGSQGGFQFGTAASTTLPSFGANTSFPSTTPTGFGNGFSFSMGTPSSASPARPSNLTALSLH